ncbi:aggrecan core protein-like [Eriocheir sinensis]|uniref:aggrecan core protein-like n=1 Tax=Eriocheir sinensis TaxID=95602 RepID=UPI0021C67C08|nr:aggrecan core protein-like [Eriocheir sinensis]
MAIINEEDAVAFISSPRVTIYVDSHSQSYASSLGTSVLRTWSRLPPTSRGEDAHWVAETQVVVPAKYRQALIELAHDAVTLKIQAGVNVGVQTVRKRLHEADLHHRTPATEPFLTATNREQRLGFALQYYPEDASFWSNVVFCDEKTFASDDHGKLHCWRPRNTRYEPENTQPSRRSGRITAGLWGWMSASGPGELAVTEERLTTQQYVQILQDVMLPTVRAMLIPAPQPIYIAMDNAPVHNSKQVEEWFRQHPEVIRIPWPPRSSDFVPIEHLWAGMTREWDGKTQDLQSALQSEACASTPVASTTIPGGSTTTPVTGGSTPTPVTGESTPTPVTGDSTPTPVTGDSTPTPVTGDSTPTPVTGESTPIPVTGESTPTPVTGESTPIPVTGESTPIPVTGESTPIPVTGGSTPTPVTGESTPTPVTGESTPIPVTGESTPIPVTGGSTPTPVTGGSTPTPVTGGSTPTPVTGGSTLTTVPVSSSEVTELSSTVTSEATTLIECVKGGEVDSTKPQTITDEPTTTTTESPWVCEAGWKLHGASCYHVDNDITLDWVKGQYFCLGKNADYVKITTNDELQFLRGLVTYDTWIGLEDRNTEGMFRWTDNSVPVFKGWHDGEPNNFENEDCTEMRKSKDFFWNDSKCSNLKRVLCQKHATKAA